MNRITFKIYSVLTLLILVQPVNTVCGSSAESKEYQVKAAFLYNFIKFVDWPKEKISDSNEPIVIGIMGKYPFGKAFEPVKDKKVRGKKVVIRRFKGFEELVKSSEEDRAERDRIIASVRKCCLLFVCSSEKGKLKEIINSIKEHPVLTVGDTAGFLEAGGIINLIKEEKKVRFEINITAAKQAKLKIGSQLLRLAKRVVKEKKKPANENN